ncbi:hypothetical protein OAT16_11830 [Prolixibacteraceae bacterium]|nr:hypothetical protein [Prolixibacteraceae bacterium]
MGIYKGHWKKLELKLGKIQSEHQVSSSIINENIHDILVLFHNAKLDVVVFEDIDRLSNAMDIFTKLRELNKTISKEKSQWINLTPKTYAKTITNISLSISPEGGEIKGISYINQPQSKEIQ